MQCGLFGKLPSKRDFVSYNMSRPFLENWENWLQAAIAESKLVLGERWQSLFLTAPIWRFWVGEKVFGQTAVGAIMPSVDGIGRYFPLSLCAIETVGTRLLPPPRDDLNQWLESAEQLLLQLLNDNATLDIPTMLRDFPFPPTTPAQAVGANMGKITNWTATSHSLQNGFSALEAHDASQLLANRGFWWTHGGDTSVEQLITSQGQPGPSFLANMISASFN